jgi:hypothetical protein
MEEQNLQWLVGRKLGTAPWQHLIASVISLHWVRNILTLPLTLFWLKKRNEWICILLNFIEQCSFEKLLSFFFSMIILGVCYSERISSVMMDDKPRTSFRGIPVCWCSLIMTVLLFASEISAAHAMTAHAKYTLSHSTARNSCL